MRRDERARLIEELGWHCDRPRVAVELLTEAETRDILKRGHVTRDLWQAIQPRLAQATGELDG